MLKDTKIAREIEILKNIDFHTEPSINTSISLDELLDEELTEQKWLIEGYIPLAGFAMISGQPTSYKTRFAFEVTLSVAQGKPLFGQFETQKTGVMIVDEESGKQLVHRQLLEQGAVKGLSIRLRSRQDFKLTEENIKNLWVECLQHDIGLVIFDSLSHIHDAKENDAPEMTRVLKLLQFLNERGITVIVIHHNRKENQFTGYGGGEVRGSSAIFAIVDAQLSLTPIGADRVKVKPNKLRYSKKPKPFELKVVGDDNTFAFEYVGSVNEETKHERLQKDILELLAVNDKLMQKEIIEALRADGIKANDKNVPPALEALVEQKKIYKVPKAPGEGNATFYALAEEAPTST